METKRKAIKELLDKAIKKSGPDMVKLVTTVGGGNMQEGFEMLRVYFTKEGKIKGFVTGSLVTGAFWGAVEGGKKIIKIYKDKKAQDTNEDILIERLKTFVEEESDENNEHIDLEHECPQCGKIARSVDEITTMFGYKETEELELIPEIFCKECRGYN